MSAAAQKAPTSPDDGHLANVREVQAHAEEHYSKRDALGFEGWDIVVEAMDKLEILQELIDAGVKPWDKFGAILAMGKLVSLQRERDREMESLSF